VQVPDGIDGLLVNGQENVPAIGVTVCGQHYRVVGLAYRLKHPPRLTAHYAGPGWPKTKRSTEGGSPDGPAVYPLPLISIQSPGVAGHLAPARASDLARRHGQGLREHHLAAPVRLRAVPALSGPPARVPRVTDLSFLLTTTPRFDAGGEASG